MDKDNDERLNKENTVRESNENDESLNKEHGVNMNNNPDQDEHIIEVSHLCKSYGDVKAVDDISFYVERGKLFAFLGPNGAGKSTTINSICTFLQPDSGAVYVNEYLLGRQDDKIRKSIGTVFQEGLLDPKLTVEENLKLRGSFYGFGKQELKEAVKRVVKEVELEEILNRPYEKLSGGQKRRCDIARALIHSPKILFLDEPTTGLDPQTRKIVWETIQRLQKEKGMTIFLTTHYMEEAEAADYCIVIDHGTIAAKGTPFNLKQKYAKDKLQLKCKTDFNLDIKKIISDLDLNDNMTCKDDFITITLENTMQALKILDMVRDKIDDFTVTKGSMDDVFIGITGEELREA